MATSNICKITLPPKTDEESQSSVIPINEGLLASCQKENSDELNKKPIIGKWEDAQEYLRDNEYIRKGYRINFNTFPRLLRSLFMCHNETTNVWSHLCGAFLFIFLIVYIAVWISPTHHFMIKSQFQPLPANFRLIKTC